MISVKTDEVEEKRVNIGAEVDEIQNGSCECDSNSTTAINLAMT